MEKSVVIEKAIEAARAVNRLLSLSGSDNEALLEVIQYCFLLPEDDPVDDSEVDSDGEWRVIDYLEGTYTIILKHNYHNILIISLYMQKPLVLRGKNTQQVWTPMRTEQPTAWTLIRGQQ